MTRTTDGDTAGDDATAEVATDDTTVSPSDVAVPVQTPSGRSAEHRPTVIARTVVRVTVPLILLTAVALLFQGHNLPGGGFIGAVLTATAFVLVYVVFGLEGLQSDLLGVQSRGDRSHRAVELYRLLFAVGLAVALGAGLAPMLVGLPFLAQGVLFLQHLPVYGELEIASAFAFDVGVYLTVIGGVLTVIGEVGSE